METPRAGEGANARAGSTRPCQVSGAEPRALESDVNISCQLCWRDRQNPMFLGGSGVGRPSREPEPRADPPLGGRAWRAPPLTVSEIRWHRGWEVWGGCRVESAAPLRPCLAATFLGDVAAAYAPSRSTNGLPGGQGYPRHGVFGGRSARSPAMSFTFAPPFSAACGGDRRWDGSLAVQGEAASVTASLASSVAICNGSVAPECAQNGRFPWNAKHELKRARGRLATVWLQSPTITSLLALF